MSQHQTMEEVSLEQLLNRYNLIVPEIQREYVWVEIMMNETTPFRRKLTHCFGAN